MHNIFKKTAALTLAAVLAAMAVGCGAEEQTPTGTGETTGAYVQDVQQTEQTLPPVTVNMPQYTLHYNGALADVILVEEHPDGSGLQFLVKLSTEPAVVFDLYYNTDAGDMVTVLTDTQGNRIPVAFAMAQLPEGLEEADENLFYAAQEAVNEIVESLTLTG